MKAKINKLVILFFLTNLLISSFYLDNWFNPNSLSRALTTYSVVHSGNLQIDEFEHLTGDKCQVKGHYYSEKAPLPSLLLVPFYTVLNSMNVVPNEPEVHFRSILILGSFLCGTLPFSIFLSLVFMQLLKTENVYRAVIMSTIPIYGSFLWIFAGTFFSHMFSGFLLLLAYLLLKNHRSYFYAGILSGFAFLCEFPVAIIVALCAAMLYYKNRSVKDVSLFSLGVLPSIAFILYYNWSITGNPFTMLYSFVEVEWQRTALYGLGIPNVMVMVKLIFSQYRGLLFYMPVFVFLLYWVIRSSLFRRITFYNNYLILPCLAYFLVFSSYHDWWGGWSYGPRQLVPISILLVYEGLLYVPKIRASLSPLFVLSFIGLFMSVLAKSTVMYSLPTSYQWPFFEVVIPEFGKGNFNDANVLTYVFGVNPGFSAIVWLILLVGSLTALAIYGHRLKDVETNPT